MIRVIFCDGSQGMVRGSRLGKMIRQGKIAAYMPFDLWVEVRRKGLTGYDGPERRVAQFY